MKNLIISVLMMSIWFTSHAQTSIGLSTGYSTAGLGYVFGEDEKEIQFITVGLPINFYLSNRFDIRVQPTFIRYGIETHYNIGEPVLGTATDGIVYYNSITTPVELRWKFLNRNKFVASFNVGIGHSYFTNGKIDTDLYMREIFSDEITMETIVEDVNFDDPKVSRHSFNGNIGFDIGYKIDDEYMVGLHLNSILGFTGLIHDASTIKENIRARTVSIQFVKLL